MERSSLAAWNLLRGVAIVILLRKQLATHLQQTTAMTSESQIARPTVPQALWIWDNESRRSLTPGILAWLFFLVGTVVAALPFRDSPAARWLFGGFVISHVVVFGLGIVGATVRRGLVSLTHLVFWGPGWLMLLQARMSVESHSLFALWSSVCILIVGVSFLFDARDSAVYLFASLTGRVPDRQTTLAAQTDRLSPQAESNSE